MNQPASEAPAIPRRPKRAMERRRGHVPTEFGLASAGCVSRWPWSKSFIETTVRKPSYSNSSDLWSLSPMTTSCDWFRLPVNVLVSKSFCQEGIVVETFGDVFQSPQELLQPQQLCEVLHIFYVQKFFFSADNFKPTIRIVLESNHVPLLNFWKLYYCTFRAEFDSHFPHFPQATFGVHLFKFTEKAETHSHKRHLLIKPWAISVLIGGFFADVAVPLKLEIKHEMDAHKLLRCLSTFKRCLSFSLDVTTFTLLKF